MANKSNNAKKRRQTFTSVFNVLLIIAVFAFFFVYVINQRHHLADLFSLSFASIVFLFLLTLGIIGSSGVINYFLYRRIGCPVVLLEGVTLAVVNILGNLLPFSGGLIGKGMYLKKRHQLAYRNYLSATLALYIFFMVANGFAGIVALTYIGFTDKWPSGYLFVGFTCLILSIMVFFFPLGNFFPQRWQSFLGKAHNGRRLIADSPTTVGVIVALKLACTCLAAGRLWVLFMAFSQSQGFSHCVVFVSGAMLTRLASITPGGLGVQEAIVGGLSVALGFQFGLAVVVTVMDRLIGVLGAGAIAAIVLPRYKQSVKKDI